MLNPNYIESVSVLKASVAIFDARGVFGVIVITTKKGEKGHTSVTNTSHFALKSPVTGPNCVTDGYAWQNVCPFLCQQ